MKGVDRLSVRDTASGAVLAVKVVAGARRERIAGVLGDCLKITTSAAPEKGKANQAVAALLARALGVDKRSVELVWGQRSPRKEFRIRGMSPGELRARFTAP